MVGNSKELVVKFYDLYKNKSRVSGLDLSWEDFSKKVLSELQVENVTFISSNFHETSLVNSRFTKCNFKEADLGNADLSHSVVRLCNFQAVNAKYVKLQAATFEDNHIEGADFSYAELENTKLTETNWSRSSLHKANLDNASGDGICFRGTDLSNASLVDIEFIDADFRGADLSAADFTNADITGADFRGAILDNVIWNGANTEGALFDHGFYENSANESAQDDDQKTPYEIKDQKLADAMEQAFSGLFSSTIENVKRDDELKKVLAQCQTWKKQKGDMKVEDLSGLVDQLEKSFSKSNIIPPEAISSFKSVFQLLESTDTDEPSDEIKELLQTFFSESDALGESASIDQVISKISSLLKT